MIFKNGGKFPNDKGNGRHKSPAVQLCWKMVDLALAQTFALSPSPIDPVSPWSIPFPIQPLFPWPLNQRKGEGDQQRGGFSSQYWSAIILPFLSTAASAGFSPPEIINRHSHLDPPFSWHETDLSICEEKIRGKAATDALPHFLAVDFTQRVCELCGL